MWLYLLLAGLVSGIIGGMGMGGGTIFIPILTIFLSIEQQSAQALNLISFIPMAIFALIIHLKNHYVVFKNSLYVIFPAIAFCVLGSFVAKSINGDILKRSFGGFLIILSILQTVILMKQEK